MKGEERGHTDVSIKIIQVTYGTRANDSLCSTVNELPYVSPLHQNLAKYHRSSIKEEKVKVKPTPNIVTFLSVPGRDEKTHEMESNANRAKPDVVFHLPWYPVAASCSYQKRIYPTDRDPTTTLIADNPNNGSPLSDHLSPRIQLPPRPTRPLSPVPTPVSNES